MDTFFLRFRLPQVSNLKIVKFKDHKHQAVNQKPFSGFGGSSHFGPIFHLASGLRSNSCISRVLTARENGDNQLELFGRHLCGFSNRRS
jgi:hypothetical protein